MYYVPCGGNKRKTMTLQEERLQTIVGKENIDWYLAEAKDATRYSVIPYEDWIEVLITLAKVNYTKEDIAEFTQPNWFSVFAISLDIAPKRAAEFVGFRALTYNTAPMKIASDTQHCIVRYAISFDNIEKLTYQAAPHPRANGITFKDFINSCGILRNLGYLQHS